MFNDPNIVQFKDYSEKSRKQLAEVLFLWDTMSKIDQMYVVEMIRKWARERYQELKTESAINDSGCS